MLSKYFLLFLLVTLTAVSACTSATSTTTETPHVIALTDHAGPVQGAAYTPDGSQLATVSLDGTVKI